MDSNLKTAGKCRFLLFLYFKWLHGSTQISFDPVSPLQCKAGTMAGRTDIYTYKANPGHVCVYSGFRVISVSNWRWSNFLLLHFLLLLFFLSDSLQGCFQFYTTHILHPKILSGCTVWSHVIETTLLWRTLTARTISSWPWWRGFHIKWFLPSGYQARLSAPSLDCRRRMYDKAPGNCYHPGLIGNLKWQLNFTDFLKKISTLCKRFCCVQPQEVDLHHPFW